MPATFLISVTLTRVIPIQKVKHGTVRRKTEILFKPV